MILDSGFLFGHPLAIVSQHVSFSVRKSSEASCHWGTWGTCLPL